jgi:AbrB family looped-hinge helix DNA binding protein
MNRQGRIVIPAPIREALGFRSGDDLILTVRNGSLMVQRVGDADTELQSLDRPSAKPERSPTGLRAS